MIAEIKRARLFPAKACRPVVISYSTLPSAKISLRASGFSPSSCSGAMYGIVPSSMPSWVSW